MTWPSKTEQLELHERTLAKDPVAPVDVYKAYVEPLKDLIIYKVQCSADDAYDSVIDALMFYMENPGSYDRNIATLTTYLADIAKKKAIDRLRAMTACRRREENFGGIIELRRPNPKAELELGVEARQVWRIVTDHVQSGPDRRALKLILEGEKSTAVLAEALGLQSNNPKMQQQEVKRHKDKLMKVLERLGKRLTHENA